MKDSIIALIMCTLLILSLWFIWYIVVSKVKCLFYDWPITSAPPICLMK